MKDDKLIFVYQCPACHHINKVYEYDIKKDIFNLSLRHQCNCCKMMHILWKGPGYWEDGIGRLNPDLKIIRGEEYMDRENRQESRCTGTASPGQPVGYLEFDGSRLPVYKRISRFHRLMFRMLLGVKYTKCS